MLLVYHHERVYQLCLKASQSRLGEAGRLLNELMEQHKTLVKKGALPEQSDMLNGDILITDSPSFEQEWKTLPVDSGPIGKSISSIPSPQETKQIKRANDEHGEKSIWAFVVTHKKLYCHC
jgi:hypothetical protein